MSSIDTFGFNWEFDGDPKKVEAVSLAVQSLVESVTELSQSIQNNEKVQKTTEQGANRTVRNAKKSNGALNSMKKSANEAGKAVKGTSTSLGQLFQAAGGTYAFSRLVQRAVSTTITMGNLAGSVDTNIESLSAWSQAVYASGEDASAFRSTVSSLSSSLTDAAVNGGPMISYLNQIGVAAVGAGGQVRDTLDVIRDIGNSPQWQRMGSRQQFYAGRALGLDDGTIRLLQGDLSLLDETIARQRELGPVTEAQEKAARDARRAYNQFFNTLDIGARKIITSALPAGTGLLNVLNGVVETIAGNDVLLLGTLGGMAAILSGPIVSSIATISKLAPLLVTPFSVVALKFAAIAAAAGLIAGDLQTWIDGGDSLTGRAIDAIRGRTDDDIRREAEATAAVEQVLPEATPLEESIEDYTADYQKRYFARQRLLRGDLDYNNQDDVRQAIDEADQFVSDPVQMYLDRFAEMQATPEENAQRAHQAEMDMLRQNRIQRFLSSYKGALPVDVNDEDAFDQWINTLFPQETAPLRPIPGIGEAPARRGRMTEEDAINSWIDQSLPDIIGPGMAERDLQNQRQLQQSLRANGGNPTLFGDSIPPMPSGGNSTTISIDVGGVEINAPGADSGEIAANIYTEIMDAFPSDDDLLSWNSDTGVRV